jgi:hypothetical protein
MIASLVTTAPPKDPPAAEERFRELYEQLVETDTSISAGNCAPAPERMAAGFPESDLHRFARPGHWNEAGLAAVYPGRGPKLKATLLLAHIDVVEAKREDRTRDRFPLVEEPSERDARSQHDILNCDRGHRRAVRHEALQHGRDNGRRVDAVFAREWKRLASGQHRRGHREAQDRVLDEFSSTVPVRYVHAPVAQFPDGRYDQRVGAGREI